jgi:hypothetical protein
MIKQEEAQEDHASAPSLDKKPLAVQHQGDDSSKAYLALLLLERENLDPYKDHLPVCSRLLEAGMLPT